MQDLSRTALVIPVFNEAGRWQEDYWAELASSGIKTYFIDDGSTDRTSQLLKKMNFGILIKLDRNRGKSEAVRFGLSEVLKSNLEIEQIGFMDADGAFEIREIFEILDKAQSHFENGFDAIWTSRVRLAGRSISRTPIRHVIGRLISTFLSTAVNDFPYDSQCGFKIYRVSDRMKNSFDFETRTRWFFELEHFANYQSQNSKQLRIWEMPLNSWTDVQGSKVYSLRSVKLLYEIGYIYLKLLRAK